MPNLVAYSMLIAWPLVTLAIFARLPPGRALVWSYTAGYLLLPVKTAFDFPGIPALDKTTIASLSAMFAALIFAKGAVLRLPREWWLNALIIVYVASPAFTALTNRDSLLFGSIVLPGMTPYDALSGAAYKAIELLPFILGYNLLRNARAQHHLLRDIAIAAIAYSLLMLIEIRLSPQLHMWTYGFFPHSFGQQVRDGGYRPVVFMGHGLLVAIFTAMAAAALAYLAKRRSQLFGISAWFWLAYLLVVLVLCRSLGALILALSATALLIVARQQTMRFFCIMVAVIVLTYPALRGAELVPVQAFADQVNSINEERASSFQTRIDNEEILLARAKQRPWFGWGGYGRNRVFEEVTGKDLSITDGTWIIIVGSNGWTGYLAAFGLLCLPLFKTSLTGRRLKPATIGLSLILAVNLLDLIPNSSLNSLTWLIVGSLAGTVRQRRMIAPSPHFGLASNSSILKARG